MIIDDYLEVSNSILNKLMKSSTSDEVYELIISWKKLNDKINQHKRELEMMLGKTK